MNRPSGLTLQKSHTDIKIDGPETPVFKGIIFPENYMFQRPVREKIILIKFPQILLFGPQMCQNVRSVVAILIF